MCEYDDRTGKPLDRAYLECNIPDWLQESIRLMQNSWELQDAGKEAPFWDCYWQNLAADLNAAEVEQIITSEQAWFLREKYLRIVREDIL